MSIKLHELVLLLNQQQNAITNVGTAEAFCIMLKRIADGYTTIRIASHESRKSMKDVFCLSSHSNALSKRLPHHLVSVVISSYMIPVAVKQLLLTSGVLQHVV